MPIILDGTAGLTNNATDLNYTGTLTGGTGVVNLGSGQIYKDASGNVGIGTSSPGSILDVVGSGNPTLTLRGSAGAYTSILKLQAAGGGGSIINATGASSDALIFQTTGTERARIDSSGNLLVGTTSVIGGDGPLLSISRNACIATMTATTGLTAAIGFHNPNGRIGYIGVSGTTTSYVTSSDYRLKDTISPMTGALAKVAQLKPCTYTWKVDGSSGQGFIAHELAAVVPGCVTGEKDAVDADGKPIYQGIDTSFLVATLTAAIQEQQAMLVSLKALVDTQAARITALEAK